MTVEIFLMLLAFCATLTSLVTQAVKIFLNSIKVSYISNVLVLIVAILVGGLSVSIFYTLNGYAWTFTNIIYIFLMICANWLVAMLGYDKVVEVFTQLKGGK